MRCLLFLVIAALAFADGKPAKPEAPDPAEIQKKAAEFKFAIGKRGGVLRDWLTEDLKTFNLPLSTDAATSSVLGNFVFESLFERDPVTLEWRGDLAAEVPTASEDPEGRVWVVKLRKDVVWSDGTAFGADDVVFSFNDVVMNDAFPIASRSTLQLTVDGKRLPITAEKVDGHAVRFTLPRRHAQYVNLLNTFWILPRHLLKPRVDEGSFLAAWDLPTPPAHVVGTGPFKLSAYVPGKSVTLSRNERYRGKDASGQSLPYLDGIEFRIVPDPFAQTEEFLAGRLDYLEMRESAAEAILQRTRRKDFDAVHMGPKPGWSYLAFNQNPRKRDDGTPFVARHKLAWFRDVRFRRAFAHTLDRERIIEEVYKGRATSLHGPYSPKFTRYFTDDVRKYRKSLKSARALLDEMDLKDRDGDGVREDAQGRPVEWTLHYVTGAPQVESLMKIVAERAAKAGLRIRLEPLAFNLLVRRVSADFDWEAVSLGYAAGQEPLLGKAVWRSGEPRRVWNPSAPPGSPDERDWEKRLDAIFDEAYTSWDDNERRFRTERDVELAHEWQRLCAEHLPHIYLFSTSQIYFVSHRLRNRRTTLHSLFDIDRLYVEE